MVEGLNARTLQCEEIHHGATAQLMDLPRLVSTRTPEATAARMVIDALMAIDTRRGRSRLAIPGGTVMKVVGLGEDGYIASLFPGDAALSATGSVAFCAKRPKAAVGARYPDTRVSAARPYSGARGAGRGQARGAQAIGAVGQPCPRRPAAHAHHRPCAPHRLARARIHGSGPGQAIWALLLARIS